MSCASSPPLLLQRIVICLPVPVSYLFHSSVSKAAAGSGSSSFLPTLIAISIFPGLEAHIVLLVSQKKPKQEKTTKQLLANQ